VLEKKRFEVANPKFYSQDSLNSLRQFDVEGDYFENLVEMKRSFPPSYPFDDTGGPSPKVSNTYAHTRAPAWCDRVLMNMDARSKVKDKGSDYFLIGKGAAVGDHKPVALAMQFT